ncbi:aldehyde dehydrogenase [Roseibium sp. TrichSKD4]|nr:aldehyde dehydrogenase [Roseibium sp. TrichSKD4]
MPRVKKRDLIGPSNETTVAQVSVATNEDVTAAVDHAVDARTEWAATPAGERGRMLVEAAASLEKRVKEASLRMAIEQGKTVAEAEGEFVRAVETLVWNGENAERLSAPLPIDDTRCLIREPIGVVAAFSPWNYPAVLSARKVAAPLAAGCPVILKAAEESPAAAVAIVEALWEAGVPAGAVSLLLGDPSHLSEQIMARPEVRVISFTGSTRVGKLLAARAAQNLQNCVLELGGNAPVIVTAGVDLKDTAQQVAEYKFEHAGQSCNAPGRVFVDQTIYDDFVAELEQAAAHYVLGPATESTTVMGPLFAQRAVERMAHFTKDAAERGAKVHEATTRPDGPGFFWPPTIISNVPPESGVLEEEVFGPILPVVPFDTIDEAIQNANASPYGLASYVFAADETTKRLVTSQLDTGSVSINMLRGVRADVPNPGRHESGLGYEGGEPGFAAFQNLKLVNGAAATLFEGSSDA